MCAGNTGRSWQARDLSARLQSLLCRPERRALLLPVLFFLLSLPVLWAYASRGFATYVDSGVISGSVLVALLHPVARDFLVFSVLYAWLPWRPGWTRAAAAALLVLFLILQAAQLQCVLLTGEMLDAELLRMAGLVEYSFNPQAAVLLGLAVGSAAVVTWLSASVMRLHQLRWPDRAWVGAAAVALLALGLLVPGRQEELDALERVQGIYLGSPAWRMALALDELARGDDPKETPEPGSLLLSEAERLGFHVDPTQRYPLEKSFIYRKPVPFPRVEGAPRNPNVLVLFIESLNAAVLGPYGSRHEGLTPNLDDFATHAIRVDDYVNHTAPTITALTGQLCSMFPAYHHDDWKKAKGNLRTSPLLCIPHLLAMRGYESTYLTHGPPGVVHTEDQFAAMGFETLIWRDDVLAALGEKGTAKVGGDPGDHQVFRALVSYLDGRASDRPFFMAVSTVGTHVGWDVPAGAKRYGDGESPVLNTFHNMDDAFGILWRWFQASPYARNTILVVTGDHAQPPTDEMRRVAESWYTGSQFARMGLFFYDPTHYLPRSFRACTSSIDFAPSILQLIGVENQPNPFLGLSMFSDRTEGLGGVGVIRGRRYFYWKGCEPTVRLTWCHKGREKCPGFDVVRYAMQLDRDGRIWPPSPPAEPAGGSPLPGMAK